MNSKTKIILGITAFVVLLGGATLAYNSLSSKISPQNSIDIAQSKGEIKDKDRVSSGSGNSGSSDSAGGNSDSTKSVEEEALKAPDFTALDSEGNEVKLSELVGKPMVLNFWASWCPPCKAEMPEFNKVYEEMGEDVTFLMVDMVDGQRETMEKGKKHIEKNGFTFPVYYDTKQEAAYIYGVSSIPTTYFIDKEGNVVTGVQGAIDEKTLRKGIAMIMDTEVSKAAEYHKITAEDAKKLLDENKDVILLDVRMQEEYDERHIEGARLIPDIELSKRAEEELPDKDATILVYCRSGVRSEASARDLVDLGYTNVYDFGGIISYPYDTVSN